MENPVNKQVIAPFGTEGSIVRTCWIPQSKGSPRPCLPSYLEQEDATGTHPGIATSSKKLLATGKLLIY